jgi:predicted RNase H-like HicB family nuclease
MKLCIKILRNDRGSFTAICSSLPGCMMDGETPEQAKERLDEAIRGYLAAVGNFCPAHLVEEVVEAAS